MNENEIAERLKRVVVEHMGIDARQYATSTNLVDDLGADSLDRIDLVLRLEEEFGIEIREEDAKKVVTVADAERLLKSYLTRR